MALQVRDYEMYVNFDEDYRDGGGGSAIFLLL